MYPESTLKMDDFHKHFQQEHDDLWPVMQEDLFAWKGCQEGYNSQFAARGRLTPEEQVIKRLQNWLIEKYRAEHQAAAS
jgi:hypothetical protein